MGEYKDTHKVISSELEEELVAAGGTGELLTDCRKAVLALSPEQLLKKLKDGSLSAVSVLEAFQAKALAETKITNCVTEFIPDAKKWAENLDVTRLSGMLFPLHGFPICIKDNMAVAGVDSTLGLRKRLGKPSESDAVIVQVFKKLGAVPFVKTNLPQVCLSIGCSNPVWGETVNPHDLSRTPGGSTGGGSALIAGGGSFLGLGGDLAGSIRMPASFCGIVGLKLTARRISNKGLTGVLGGLVGIFNSAGVIGRDSYITVEATKALLSHNINQLDFDAPPVAWREDLFKRSSPLRVGWYDSDGLLPTTPGVKRAVASAIDAFKEQGYEIVPFAPPDHEEAMQTFSDFIFADQGTTAEPVLRDEIHDHNLIFYSQFSTLAASKRNVAIPLLKLEYGDIISKNCASTVGSCSDLWKKRVQMAVYAEKMYKRWKEHKLDVLVCPVFPTPAPKKETVAKLTMAGIYCMVYNLLDFPTIAVPVTRQTEEDEKLLQDYVTTDYLHELFKEDTRGAVGMPLGVQIVALPYCEEVLCRAALELDKAINFKL